MLVVWHRINTAEELKKVPRTDGVEVDLRDFGKDIILHHDPLTGGELFSDFLNNYNHAFIILNIKSEGIEKRVIEMAEKRGIKDYFLLDVTFPFMLKLAKEGIRKISVRFSEYESIETVKNMEGLIDWVFIDVNTKLPLDTKSYDYLKKHFKICLVSPDRWGRPEDISKYIGQMKKDGIKLDAVLTGGKHAEEWKRAGL